MVAGALGGAVARILTAPFDILKIRYQIQTGPTQTLKYTSLFQSWRTIAKEEGGRALWKGNLSATYLWVTYSTVQFGVYGVLKDVLLSADGSGGSGGGEVGKSMPMSPSHLYSFIAGAGAGLVATTATYPLDIMRTQFAIQGQQRRFRSVAQYFTHTMQTRGLRGFYSGLTPAAAGVVPYMGLNFALYVCVCARSSASPPLCLSAPVSVPHTNPPSSLLLSSRQVRSA